MDLFSLGLLFGASLLAGALNAVAGGATFLTFPALMLAGLTPIQANATNFVALTPANIAALPAFRAELAAIGRGLAMPLTVGAIGGVVGAVLLLVLGGGVFAQAVPWLMAVATGLFIAAPSINRVLVRSGRSARSGPVAMLLMFAFSVYGGYFGAGLGQIMLAALVIAGWTDLHQANALKNASIAAISLASVVLMALSGYVHWPSALLMMVGASLGGYFGGRVSRLVPARALRYAVIAFGVFLTVRFFWVGA
jgi:uncharacterized membrane protein YfcA